MFKIPSISQRLTIVGKTGSGKTQGGAYILSQAPFNEIPYVVCDFKGEPLFAEIDGIREISLTRTESWRVLNQSGLFVIRPRIDQQEQLEAFLWYVWENENIGLFIDEGYMIGRSNAFVACLTQGRSKNIPIITLSQRPAWITKFAFSEADYLMIFRLLTKTDKKTVQEFVDADISKALRPHWSYWYDVNRDELAILRPVPDREVIKRIFNTRLNALQQRVISKQFV